MNNTSVLSVAKNRVVWLDVVRFVAMFTVVCCHCADPFNFYSGEPSAGTRGDVGFLQEKDQPCILAVSSLVSAL